MLSSYPHKLINTQAQLFLLKVKLQMSTVVNDRDAGAQIHLTTPTASDKFPNLTLPQFSLL